MQTALKKLGDSLAITIPSTIIKNLDLKEDSLLTITQKNNQIIIQKNDDLQSLCANINEQNLNIDSIWNDTTQGKEW